MSLYGRVSTGLKGLDEVIDHLRFGDNVVWQVDSIPGYRKMVGYFAESARNDNRDLVYIRFAAHEPLLDEASGIKTCHVDAPCRTINSWPANGRIAGSRKVEK
jgi:hypothetical protein